MELAVLQWIQSFSNGFLDILFQGITLFGEQMVIVALITAVYWLYDRDFGEYLIISLLASLLLNNGIKNIFKLERPIGQEGIRTLREHTATGYSFPSGHTQTVTTFLWSAAAWLRKRWVYIVAAILPIAVGLSRLYLGVHYPKDVLAGLALGAGMSYIMLWLFRRVRNRALLMLVAAALSAAVFLPFGASEDFLKVLGMSAGFSAATAFERKFVRWEQPYSFRIRLLRWILCLAVMGAAYYGLKLICPDTLVFDFLRYFVFVFVGLGLYPLTFRRVGGEKARC